MKFQGVNRLMVILIISLFNWDAFSIFWKSVCLNRSLCHVARPNSNTVRADRESCNICRVLRNLDSCLFINPSRDIAL